MTGIFVAVLLGWAGGYQFYKNKIGMGILYFFTFGLFGIGWIVDVITAFNEYRKNNNPPANPTSSYNEVKASSPIEPTFYVHYSKATEKNIGQLQTHYIVIDTETTGVNAVYDRMVSVAALEVKNGIPVRNFYTLVKPDRSITKAATEVNGITNKMVSTAPSEHDACIKLLEFLGDAVFGKTLLVAYNAPFDAKIIKNAMERYQLHGNVRFFDALTFSRQTIKGLPNYKQVTVAEHFGIDTSNAHNSLRDCEICAEIINKLV